MVIELCIEHLLKFFRQTIFVKLNLIHQLMLNVNIKLFAILV